MELEISFRNVDSSDAIKAWANKRFQKATKHLNSPTSAHLTLTVDKHRHRAELTVHTHGEVLRASEETDDMYTSLDQVMAKIEHAAQRHKERIQER